MNPKKRHLVDENEAQERLREAKRITAISGPLIKNPVGREIRLKEIVVDLAKQSSNQLQNGKKVAGEEQKFAFGGGSTLVPYDIAYNIFQYQRLLEERFSLPANFLVGKRVNWRMREKLIDWLNHVQESFELLPETQSLAIYLLDASVLKMSNICKENYQALGVACLFLASKYEQVLTPPIEDFVYVGHDVFKKDDIIQMEREVLAHCSFELGRPNFSQFLRNFRFCFETKPHVYQFSKYACEVTALVYSLASEKPSVVAAAAIYLASVAYGERPPSTSSMTSLLGPIDVTDILPIARALVDPVFKFLDEFTKHYALRERYGKILKLTPSMAERLSHFSNSSMPLKSSNRITDLI